MPLPAPTPCKVLVVIPSLETGGAEMDLVRNLPRIDRGRFSISVCTFIAPGRLAPLLEAQGIEVIAPRGWRAGAPSEPVASGLPTWIPRGLPLRRFAGNIWRYTQYARHVARVIRERDVDLVHAVLPNAYLAAAIAKLVERRPLVMSRLSLNWYQRDMPLVGLIERRLLHGLADAAICNCEAIRRDLIAEGMQPEKITIVANGIEPATAASSSASRARDRQSLELPADALVITKIANLHRYKGHADLIAALALAHPRLPDDWLLLCAGRGSAQQRGELQVLTERAGLSAHIRFLGERDDVPALLQAADIHVSASHTEGFPNNILEAMNSGLPVIAAKVGGVPELVAAGETGLFVPPHDPPALAGAILRLAGDPALRRSMGEAGYRRVVSKFSLERSAAGLSSVYERFADRERAPLTGSGL